jgi:pimeloyl-ACP methyl ester carboxylesterase
VTVVGLGSGGTIALEAAGHGFRGVDRFVAVAPGRPPAVHGSSGAREVVVVVDPSEEQVAAGFRAWIGQAGVRLDLLAGLGHAYPASFADYFAALLLDDLDDTSVASGQRRNASRSVLPSLPDGGA